MMLAKGLVVVLVGFAQLVAGQNATNLSNSTYTNPILNMVGADP